MAEISRDHEIRTHTSNFESVYENVIGNTPLLRFKGIVSDLPETVEVYGKAEWFNPGGSVKDRPAAAILRQALDEGILHTGKTLLDSTSGNMGIAYATLGATMGVRLHLAVPANAGHSRLSLLRSLGAEITLTDPLEGSDGAREVAAKMAERNPDRFYFADQYSQAVNWQAHYHTTGPEVVFQTSGRVTHFIAGLGTTGTLMGTGRYLKEILPNIHLTAVQPDGPMHGLEGLKHLTTSEVPKIFDPSIPDEIIAVRTEDAYAMARRMAYEEGMLVGISSAAATVAALQVAQKIESGVVVALLPDSGHKYLDQAFWSVP